MQRETVLIQLRRLLDSDQLRNSSVLNDFLTFVVTETLAGRGGHLKEYTIGIQALKKETDFNPQLDSIVRIHAGRLRRALKEYYYEDGKDDPIIFSIPKGSYTPVFKSRSDEISFVPHVVDDSYAISPASGTAIAKQDIGFNYSLPPDFGVQNKPAIEISNFKNIGSASKARFFASGLGECLSTELTHFQNIRVISAPSMNKAAVDHADAGVPNLPDFVLSGSVQWLKGHLRIWVHLDSVFKGEQIWAQTFERTINAEDDYEFQERVVDQVLASIMGINGAISRYQSGSVDRLHPQPGFCYPIDYWFYHHVLNFNQATTRAAKQFYEGIMVGDPGNALACAYLSQICSGEMLMRSQGVEKSLDDGLRYAHQAIKCDPHGQEAFLALATNLLFRGLHKEAVQALEQGAVINAKSNDFKGSMGALLVYMGHYERGKALLDSAFSMTPYLPWWHILAISYYNFHTEKFTDAIFWLERIETSKEQIPLLKAASFAHLEEFDRAFDALDHPALDKPIEAFITMDELGRHFQPQTLALKVQSGLKKLVEHKSIAMPRLSILPL